MPSITTSDGVEIYYKTGVPYVAAGPKSAEQLANGILKKYNDFPHGLPTTHADVLNPALLAFFRS